MHGNNKHYYYYCNKAGNHQTRGNNDRSLKNHGSSKAVSHCSAYIQASDVKSKVEKLNRTLSSHHFYAICKMGSTSSNYESAISRAQMRSKYEQLVKRCGKKIKWDD